MKSEFSLDCKTEVLDNFRFSKRDCCNASFLEGYFFRENLTENLHKIRQKQDVFKAGKVIKKLLSRYDIYSYVIEKEPEGKEPYSKLYITEDESLSRLVTLQTEFPKCEQCIRHFLKGIFVADGVVYNPEREYHLEFSYKEETLADTLLSILAYHGFNFSKITRRKSFVVYTKNSETIEDFLATVGAQNNCLLLMSSKVVKDINLKNNRVKNRQSANTAKTIKAGEKVNRAIIKLIDTGLLYELPDELQNLAQLKLENPTRSLAELARMCQEKTTKSAVNRRLHKLCKIAQIEE